MVSGQYESTPCKDCGGTTYTLDYGYKRRRPYEMCVTCGRGGADWRNVQAKEALAHRLKARE